MIRQATHSDAPFILTCLAEAFAPFRESYTTEAFLDTVPSCENIKDRMKYMTIFVAEFQALENHARSIVGTVACHLVSPQEGHLRGMAVLPSWQGTTVAQLLLERAEDELRKRKCLRITLDTTAPLKRAISFYERNGFRPSGRVTDFFVMSLFEYAKTLDEKRAS